MQQRYFSLPAGLGIVAILLSVANFAGVGAGRMNSRLRFHNSSRPLTSCGVVGASADSECTWRWQVALSSEPGSQPWCGGVLVHKEWVLTAAHCVSRPPFNVLLGGIDLSQRGRTTEQTRWSLGVHTHPDYTADPASMDFALVRLNAPVAITGCVGTVCLPSEGADVEPGKRCWVTGWGTLKAGSEQSQTFLQEVEVTAMGNEDCSGSGDLDDSLLCAQGRTKDDVATDACLGDRGGPLVCEDSDRWTLYGAATAASGCAGEGKPGVWSRIHEAVAWIDETLEINSGPAAAPWTGGKCPDFARFEYPDSSGECQCKVSQKCSASGGSAWDCPAAESPGGRDGEWFLATCANCTCHESGAIFE